MTKPFQVLAGKYESYSTEFYSADNQESIAFSVDVETLDDALKIYEQVNDFPWSRIEYNGWKIEGRKE